MKPLHLVIPWLLAAGFSTAQPSEKLAEYETAFKARHTELDARQDQTIAATRSQYEKALDRLSRSFQAQGKLTETLVVRKEIRRLEQSGTVAKSDVVDSPAELRKLQINTIQSMAKAVADRNLSELRLLQTYVKTLNRLKSDLTKASDIEGAVIVHDRARAVHETATGLLARINPVTGAPRYLTHKFGLNDLDALKKDWRFKGSNFNADETGLHGPKGPANELESLFKMRGDFEVSLAFKFGRAAYTNTGGTWMNVCGERLLITNSWGGFSARIKVERKGRKLIYTNNDKVTEVEIKPENLDKPTRFYLWWRSRSFHFKELEVKTDRFIRE